MLSDVDLSAAVRHARRARLRRIALAAVRALAGAAGDAAPLRAPLPDRRADARGADRAAGGGAALRPGLRHGRVRRRGAVRHGAAPRRRSGRDRRRGIRAANAGGDRHAECDRDPPCAPHFQHVFSGDGYAAGYYSYLWSEALDADAFEAFEETGDDFDPALAERLKRFVYAAGNTREPDEAYRRFRGADPSPDALLRKRGLGES